MSARSKCDFTSHIGLFCNICDCDSSIFGHHACDFPGSLLELKLPSSRRVAPPTRPPRLNDPIYATHLAPHASQHPINLRAIRNTFARTTIYAAPTSMPTSVSQGHQIEIQKCISAMQTRQVRPELHPQGSRDGSLSTIGLRPHGQSTRRLKSKSVLCD